MVVFVIVFVLCSGSWSCCGRVRVHNCVRDRVRVVVVIEIVFVIMTVLCSRSYFRYKS